MASTVADKLIISNCDQLTNKYGAAGMAAINKAVRGLVKADASLGIVAEFVDLSDAKTMKAYGAPAIPAGSAGNAKLNKQAIDRIFTSADVRPAYLMLLGSTDVIPHVLLDNPMAGDGDPNVPSDLPYACEAPYSTDVQDFTAPTRVVGRLPNVTNDRDPTYLIGLLGTAETYKERPASDYNAFLGISAQVWTKSTELSLYAIFGTHAGMKIAPPDGYKWTAAEAKRLAHFVNCHGANGDPNFYGQKGGAYPIAHSAAWMAKKLVEGTVMAAECCYGAELYDPSIPTAGGQMGMCNTYLGGKAYAYFGSTTIAYGPDTTNDEADLICQNFGIGIGEGASAGRACLQARLDYVSGKSGILTPTDLKTLGQFNLMADPALTPVAVPQEAIVIHRSGTTAKEATAAVARHARTNRRATLVERAVAAPAYRLAEPTKPAGGAKSGVLAKLRKLAADHGIKTPDVFLSYSIGHPTGPSRGKGLPSHRAAVGSAPEAIHTVFERLDPPKKLPHLALVRGVHAVEYEDGMDARVFESR